MLVEIKKAALNGAFGSASKKALIVVPQVNLSEPLKLMPLGYKKAWPDIINIFDNKMQIIRVTEDDARTICPIIRLNLGEIQGLGMLHLKDSCLNAKVTYVTERITWGELAELALKYNLIGYLHKEFLKFQNET